MVLIKNIFKNISSRLVKQSLTYAKIIECYANQPIWTPTDFKTMAKEGYKQNIYVYSCIRNISMAFAGVPWGLYKTKRSKNSQREEIDEHPLLKLWDKPNERQGGTKFRENVMAYLLITGNSYIERVGPSPQKPPMELYTIRPDRISILPGDKQHIVRGYSYDIGTGRPVVFPAEQILHLLMFDPLDDWYGMSPLKAASRSVDQNNMSRSWNVALLQNGARPPGVLKTEKGLTDTQFNRLDEKWQDRYAGWKNAGVPIILEGGLEWQEMGLSPQDMAWLEGTKLSAREIAIAFGVPPEIIGDSTNKTYSNYQEARKSFYEETILPLLDWYKDEVNNWITPLFGDGMEMDYDKDEIEALQEDRDKVWTRVKDADFLKVNEKREALGYDHLDEEEGGELVLLSNTKSTVLKNLVEGEEDEVEEEIDEELDEEALEAEQMQEEDLNPTDVEVEKAKMFLNTKSFNLKSNNQKAEYWKAVETTRTPFYKNAENIIKKRLNIERKAVIKLIKESDNIQDAETKINKYLNSHYSDWDTIIKGIYISVGETFANMVINSIKSELSSFGFKAEDIWYQIVQDWLNNNSSEKVKQINETTKSKLKEQLAEGVSKGEGILEIAKRVDDLYLKQIIPNRSVVIARTEVISASNLGSRAGAKQTGLDLKKEWISTLDKRTRDAHRTANGQTKEMDEPYVVKGQKLMFPGDSSLGASGDNVIQCRCTEGYIVKE